MNKLIATNDITDDWGNTIVPRGTVLERRDGVYTGRNPQTGNLIRMEAKWAENEVYCEYFEQTQA